MNFSMSIEEALATIQNTLDEMTDEQISMQGELLINNFISSLQTPETEEIMENLIKEIDLNGITPQETIAELQQGQYIIFKMIEELKERYPDSPIKQGYCDMLMSGIETYFLNFIQRLSNRDSVNIGVELIHNNAKVPAYMHEGDQGADIYAVEEIIIKPHTYGNVIPTGLKVLIPHDWCLSIRPRSGLSKNSTLRISNSPATIDQQYRGEIKILFDNIGDSPVTIKAGERIAQMILERNYQAKYHKVDSVEPDTERGEDGFGSSGL